MNWRVEKKKPKASYYLVEMMRNKEIKELEEIPGSFYRSTGVANGIFPTGDEGRLYHLRHQKMLKNQ